MSESNSTQSRSGRQESVVVEEPAPLSRRHFVQLASMGVAAAWFGFEKDDLVAAGRHALTAQRFETLNALDAADIEAAAAQIVPADNTPGAREARVIYFIDRALGSFAKEQRPIFEMAAAELRDRAKRADPKAKSFAALSAARQIEVLTAMDHDKSKGFAAIREATIAGMLANPDYGGNHDKAGWRWIGFVDQFSWAAPFGWYDRDA